MSVIFVSCRPASGPVARDILDVCDLLDGKTAVKPGIRVKLIGRLEGADHHGYYLSVLRRSDACACSQQMLLAQPSAIALKLPELDRARLMELLNVPPVIVAGEITSKWPVFIYSTKDGFEGNGYGLR